MVKFSTDLHGQYEKYLNDESGIFRNGDAERIYFPESEAEIVEIVKQANVENMPITISGGGTGISGGRAPIGGWIIATDRMQSVIVDEEPKSWTNPETGISYQYLLQVNGNEAFITLPVSITVKAIQTLTREHGWYYPPDPTERSCFIGGNINTNASGARSFKYGCTRDWVERLRIVLPSSEVLDLKRSKDSVGNSIVITTPENTYELPRPTYSIPRVSKNVAGPVITDKSNLLDVFIGSDGLFGIVTQVTLRLIKQPKSIVTFFAFCPTKELGLDLIDHCQAMKQQNKSPVPMSVEMLDERAISIMHDMDSEIPHDSKMLIFIEQDVSQDQDTDEVIEVWFEVFSSRGIEDVLIAQTYSEIEHFKELRHAVPETVNGIVRSHGQAKIGSDISVPWNKTRWIFEQAWEIGNEFESYQNAKQALESYGYALWAHAGDAHLHLNLIPRDEEEYNQGNLMVLKLIKEVIEVGGSMAAEHGLGKKYFDARPALEYQIGRKGIEEIKKMKQILDPHNLLNRGNLTGYTEFI